MSLFLPNIDKVHPLSQQSREALIDHWHRQSVGKDHFLVKENTVADQFFYIHKGIARIYYRKNEKEITEWIAMDDNFFLSINSFFTGTPSKLIIQTIEPSEVSGIRYADLMQLCEQYHDIETWLRKVLTASLIASQHRMESLQFESAQERYKTLLSKNPTIVQRVPLGYIASWLGITQETLSRIRASI